MPVNAHSQERLARARHLHVEVSEMAERLADASRRQLLSVRQVLVGTGRAISNSRELLRPLELRLLYEGDPGE